MKYSKYIHVWFQPSGVGLGAHLFPKFQSVSDLFQTSLGGGGSKNLITQTQQYVLSITVHDVAGLLLCDGWTGFHSWRTGLDTMWCKQTPKLVRWGAHDLICGMHCGVPARTVDVNIYIYLYIDLYIYTYTLHAHIQYTCVLCIYIYIFWLHMSSDPVCVWRRSKARACRWVLQSTQVAAKCKGCCKAHGVCCKVQGVLQSTKMFFPLIWQEQFLLAPCCSSWS